MTLLAGNGTRAGGECVSMSADLGLVYALALVLSLLCSAVLLIPVADPERLVMMARSWVISLCINVV